MTDEDEYKLLKVLRECQDEAAFQYFGQHWRYYITGPRPSVFDPDALKQANEAFMTIAGSLKPSDPVRKRFEQKYGYWVD